jgi:hypothetical protein
VVCGNNYILQLQEIDKILKLANLPFSNYEWGENMTALNVGSSSPQYNMNLFTAVFKLLCTGGL